MGSATNVDAVAVNTIAWLAAAETSIVVPVYQRQYRWDIGGCEQLLADVRAAASSHERGMHFIGSILSTLSTEGAGSELVLIDGQQRITTIMLLIAALHHTVRDDDPLLAAQMQAVLVRAGDPDRTKLRPHHAWAEVFERLVLDRPPATGDVEGSRFDSNYAFFRSQVRPDEVALIWQGLQRLEHVAITLGAGANAQQIFESLNSTGEPLRDHELIHNYVLMGLSHAEQTEMEEAFWVPIEQNTGERIGAFWRDYLVMTTGREVQTRGGRGVYDAFRSEFPRLDLDTLRTFAAHWRAASEVYRSLSDPTREPDALLSAHLRHVNTFGRAMYPLLMRVFLDHRDGTTDAAAVLATLEAVQSLLLRRTIAGTGTDRLVARLCRARQDGAEALERAFARITPSDDRVRVSLRYGALPNPAYVLARMAGVDDPSAVEVDHIVPLVPAEDWTADGARTWSEFSEDEQNSHRALAPTLGNLTLIEEPLAVRAFDAPFPTKREVYARSAIPMTRDVAAASVWNTTAITQRTTALTRRFVEIWPKPAIDGIDDDGLTPILDAVRRRGWPPGWQQEFEYVEYRGEHWEVYDVRYLFNRIFRRLWSDARADVVSFSARRGGPIYDAPSWQGQWDTLDDVTHLYMGWDSQYMLTAVQGVLEEAGIAAEVFVKYSYIGAAMR